MERLLDPRERRFFASAHHPRRHRSGFRIDAVARGAYPYLAQPHRHMGFAGGAVRAGDHTHGLGSDDGGLGRRLQERVRHGGDVRDGSDVRDVRDVDLNAARLHRPDQQVEADAAFGGEEGKNIGFAVLDEEGGLRNGEGVFDGAQSLEPLVALLVGKEALAVGVWARTQVCWASSPSGTPSGVRARAEWTKKPCWWTLSLMGPSASTLLWVVKTQLVVSLAIRTRGGA